MRLLVSMGLILCSTISWSQALEGKWTGRIEHNARINLTIDSNLNIVVPGAIGVKADILDSNQSGDSLWVRLKLAGTEAVMDARYDRKTAELSGVWKQQHLERPIILTKVDSFSVPKRMQTPSPPFPYRETEMRVYQSQQDFWLSGTLTAPAEGLDSTVFILITGSGAQDRNSELLGHKPFLVLSDYLTRQGISVYRYDERGVGESSGVFFNATSADFLADVLAIVDKFDSLGYTKIGLIGHSEGGLIANMACAQDDRISAMVSLAGPGFAADELMLIQNRNILLEQGVEVNEVEEYIDFISRVYELIDVDTPKDSLYDPLKELCFDFYESRDTIYQKMYGPSSMGFYIANASGYLTPWLRYFINHDPGEYIPQISCPVLALNGIMDIQVSVAENLAAYENYLLQSQAPFYDVIALDSINHLFQKVDHWNTNEYYESTETFNGEVMQLIAEWIKTSVF